MSSTTSVVVKSPSDGRDITPPPATTSTPDRAGARTTTLVQACAGRVASDRAAATRVHAIVDSGGGATPAARHHAATAAALRGPERRARAPRPRTRPLQGQAVNRILRGPSRVPARRGVFQDHDDDRRAQGQEIPFTSIRRSRDRRRSHPHRDRRQELGLRRAERCAAENRAVPEGEQRSQGSTGNTERVAHSRISFSECRVPSAECRAPSAERHRRAADPFSVTARRGASA